MGMVKIIVPAQSTVLASNNRYFHPANGGVDPGFIRGEFLVKQYARKVHTNF